MSVNPTVGNIVGLGIVGLTSQCKITPQCHVLPTLTSQCSHSRTHIHKNTHTDVQTYNNPTMSLSTYMLNPQCSYVCVLTPQCTLCRYVCMCVCVCVWQWQQQQSCTNSLVFEHAVVLTAGPNLPYSGKRKQVTKVKFLVKEQNVSVISTDVNGISWCLT